VAGFVASTLVSLVGAVLVSARVGQGVGISFAIAFLAGAIGVFAMIAGAVMLARETTYSFRVLREEKNFVSERVQRRMEEIEGSGKSV
jgi:drug/metabolite transporter (DMT)-like permease